jgi:hypothetical protein
VAGTHRPLSEHKVKVPVPTATSASNGSTIITSGAYFQNTRCYPNNLIPICKVCNGKKVALYQQNGVRLFKHLFSELQGVTGFLRIEIDYDPRLNVRYSVRNPGTLSQQQFAVLEKHFESSAATDYSIRRHPQSPHPLQQLSPQLMQAFPHGT